MFKIKANGNGTTGNVSRYPEVHIFGQVIDVDLFLLGLEGKRAIGHMQHLGLANVLSALNHNLQPQIWL